MDSAPEGRTRVTRFVQFLRHLRSDSPLIVPDEENIAELAQNPRIRAEQDLRGHDAPTPEQFLQSVSRTAVFPTAEAGLKRLGWAEIPGSESRLGEGRRGTIMLAYKLSDRKVPLESRHLCAAKLQPRGDYTALSGEPLHEVMTEVDILRAVVHENVVDYFGHFGVQRKCPTPRIYILLEYASAGDLEKEIGRYPLQRIGEVGARYYGLQICDGVDYLHKKGIVHGDLHVGNIVLKYNPDGSKTCMICDFGSSIIASRFLASGWASSASGAADNTEPELDKHFRWDVQCICDVCNIMIRGFDNDLRHGFLLKLSPEADDLLKQMIRRGSYGFPPSVPEMKQAVPWFHGPAAPPFPKKPTPLLHPKQIKSIGYLPERKRLPPTSPQASGSGAVARQAGPSAVPGRETSEEAAGRASLGTRMRRSLSSFGRAVVQPFRRVVRRNRGAAQDPLIHGEEEESEEPEEVASSRSHHQHRGPH